MTKREIRDVWQTNFKSEIDQLCELCVSYPYVAMDTEFPGVIARPINSSSSEFNYQIVRCNVNILKLIQLGLTLCDKDGNVAEDCPIWQFNFKFDLQADMYAQDSISLLSQAGIDWKRHASHGIDTNLFAEMFMGSGLLLNPDVRWITFHSGYDFGYLLRAMTGCELPEKESEFLTLLSKFFPGMLDIKHMIQHCEPMWGHYGLNRLAVDLNVERHGPQHQAGSDSLLTAHSFFQLRESMKTSSSSFKESQFVGMLFGFGESLQLDKL
eukprot:TRINITY_DN2801_c0_g1_i1.p1 TRINITY_DN2801_c0_g1~~TRINITY_DN2801_c0_g1_i1.p1  ORF type:complete len:268 (+),score=22.77 TRINITY_DN2801_c0_g1_i1:161-964(+)